MASSRTCQVCDAEEAILMVTIFTPGFSQLIGMQCLAGAAIGITEAQAGVPLVITPEWLAQISAQDAEEGAPGPDESPGADEVDGPAETDDPPPAEAGPPPVPKSAGSTNGTAPEATQPAQDETASTADAV